MVAHLRAVCPSGPCRLCGFTLDGKFVHEIARQLIAVGEEVPLVALMDADAPGYPRRRALPARLALHLRELARLGPVGARRHLRERLAWHAARRRGERERLFDGAVGDSAVARARQASTDAMLEVWRVFEPGRHAGRMLVIRAARSPLRPSVVDDDPALGWGSLVDGGLALRALDCAHREMLDAAQAPALARILEPFLAAPAPGAAVGRRATAIQEAWRRSDGRARPAGGRVAVSCRVVSAAVSREGDVDMSERPEGRTSGGWVAWIALLLGVGIVLWHLLLSGHPPPSSIDGPGIEARVSGLETTLQQVEQQVAGANGEVARVGEGLAAAGRRLEGVEGGTTPAIRQLGEAVSGLASRLSALESRPATAPSSAAAPPTGAAAAAASAASAAAVQREAAASAASAASAAASAAAVQGEAAALAASLRQRMDAIESARVGAHTALTAQVARLTERVDSTVSKAMVDDAKLTETVVDIGRKLVALEARFSTPDRAHAELLKTIERLELQIADLKLRSLRDAAELGRLYFGFNSWELTASERLKLQTLVEQSTMKDKVISLVGFADRTGTDDYNQLLSTRRVAVVRDALLKMGVPAALIATANGLGAMGAPVATPAGVPERENRVVFVFGSR
jgi:outer membrane protein OmpA-like peptidoglycan-associated protein/thioesterase domain-containing protein